jgi:predicted phosphodiesterase
VATDVIRIFSDLHYGDRASTLCSLADLRPLLDGTSQIVLNGDTLDTRSGPNPAATKEALNEVTEFFAKESHSTIWLTGNHDPDISDQHAVELRDRRVYVTHGDILFDNLVPWSRDAGLLGRRVAAELASLGHQERLQLRYQFVAARRAAASVPQRHQSERHPVKYAVGLAADTIWPPFRIFNVLKAWRETPLRAAALLKRHELPARVFVMGHTHRRGITHTRDNICVINTGSFCPPCAGAVVDVAADQVRLRSVVRQAGEFRLGDTIAEFALAHATSAQTITA